VRVLHVPFTFAPDPIGGTEVYVEALAQELRPHGIDSLIAAPAGNGAAESYEHNGLRVRRYRSAHDSERMLRELYGEGDPVAARAFARILDEETPDIVHMHAFTRAVSVLVVRAAKQRRLPVVFTYHTPTASCERGSLMRLGKELCDGALMVRRCTDCSLEGRGLPRWLSFPLGYVPSFLALAVEQAGLEGGVWTSLRMTELIRARCQSFQNLMQEVDNVVALREWVQALLERNGVPRSKITLSPHGVPGLRENADPLLDVSKVPLRVAFFGRADKVKGVDTLIKAVRADPALPIELHLYGVTQSAADQAYWATLPSLIGQDARISLLPHVPHDKIVALLRSYHLLAVPSRWLETGPLVILESFSAGTPVIGSNLGGIAEMVRHEKNGLLVGFDDIGGWTDALRRCAEDRRLLSRLREGVEVPRSMRDVAQEMAQMYHRHADPKADSPPRLHHR